MSTLGVVGLNSVFGRPARTTPRPSASPDHARRRTSWHSFRQADRNDLQGESSDDSTEILAKLAPDPQGPGHGTSSPAKQRTCRVSLAGRWPFRRGFLSQGAAAGDHVVSSGRPGDIWRGRRGRPASRAGPIRRRPGSASRDRCRDRLSPSPPTPGRSAPRAPAPTGPPASRTAHRPRRSPRSAARVSLRPNPSVPSAVSGRGSQRSIESGQRLDVVRAATMTPGASARHCVT